MNIRYSYRLEDFEDVAETADKLSPRGQRIRFALILAGVLLLLAPFLTGNGPLHPDQFLLGMGPLALGLIVWGLQNPRRVARKCYAKEIDGTEYEATITEDAIITISPTARIEFKWAAFSRVIQGQNAVALVDKTVMYLFPKRAFTPEQWDNFLGRLQKYVPVGDGSIRTVRLP